MSPTWPPDPNEPLDPELDALLRTWAEAEADDVTPLLVLADWLQERNDPRAELMRVVAKQPAPNSEFKDDRAWFERYWPEVMKSVSVYAHMRDETSIQIGNEFVSDYPIPEIARPLLRDGWIQSAEVSAVYTPWFREALPLPRLRYLDIYGLPGTQDAIESVSACRNLRGLGLTRSSFSAEQLRLLRRLPKLTRLDLVRSSVTDQSMVAITELTGLRHLGISNASVTDQTLVRLRRLKWLEGLTVFETDVTDIGLESLRRLPRLKRANLTWVGSADRGAQSIASLRQVESLRLGSNPISDHGLSLLGALTQLKSLSLDARAITDEGLRFLTGMKKLETLFLCPASITPSGILQLRWLPELKDLSLPFESTDDEMVEALSQFPMLETLHLHDRVSDLALEHLPRMKRLCQLSFFCSPITDEGILRHLTSMEWLKSIWFLRTRISPETAAKLREALPNCEIEHDERT